MTETTTRVAYVDPGHVCRTFACLHEHARNEDGSPRCLWSSRNGRTPTRRPDKATKWMCSQPHRFHDGPHVFTLQFKPRASLRTHMYGIVGALGGSLAAVALVQAVRALVEGS